MKRPNEELCKAKFNEYIANHFPETDIDWQDGDEPPDYYITLNKQKYAVEVTDLIEKIDVGSSKPLPMIAIRSFLSNYAKELEATARQEGLLKGTYLVIIRKPPKNFSTLKDNLSAHIINYVSQTLQHEATPPVMIFSDSTKQKITIQKIRDTGQSINIPPPVLAKWEGEANEQLCDLVQERLYEKIYRLRKISVPKILLLYDRYLFADREAYQNCFHRLQNIDNYYAVFIVSENQSFMLHLKDSGWTP